VTASRVGRVALRVRVAHAERERAAALREAAEQRLVRGVVEAIDDRVRARLGPQAIVWIERLPVRWKLAAAELADAAVHVRLGEELADGVLAELGVASPSQIPARPPAGARAAVFADAAHQLAVALAERAEGREVAGYHPAKSVAALWAAACAGGPDEVAQVIDRLMALGAAPAIAQISVEAAVAVCAALPSRWPAGVRAVVGVAATGGGGAAPPPAERAPTRGVAASLALAVGDDTGRGAVGSSAPVDAGASEGTALDVGMPPQASAPRETIAATSPWQRTAIAGAAFLVGRALELEVAEALWCAGIPEGAAIAAAIAALVPAHADDPLLAAIAGGDRALPDVPAWATDEAIAASRDGLGRWLARRGDARTPAELDGELARTAATLVETTPLAQRLAAILVAAACARLEVAWDLAALVPILVVDGELADGDELVVELPASAVDVDVRRAGLDLDPGHVPWLGRRVRIRYAGGETL
jgi:hypothetical protein